MTELSGHGGELAVRALRRFGVREIFTLSGGHIFPFYDAARAQDVRIVDVRHEATATFAAEGMAKLTRRPGVAVLTAGPGVTNGVSAVTSAWFNGSPLVVLGGRAPQGRWGAGSLQEFDHVPVLAPITKHAATVTAVERIGADVVAATAAGLTPHRGPVFLDFPLDVIFATGTGDVPDRPPITGPEPDPDDVHRAAAMLAAAERPALIAGTDLYWAGAWGALRELVETFGVPTFVNGLGRGCLPADHHLAFSRTRGLIKTEADLVVVVGTPLDFRLSFGRFGDARVVHIVDHPSQRAAHAEVAVSPAGDLTAILEGMASWEGERRDHTPWIERLRAAEDDAAAAEAELLAAATTPIKPTRVYGELRRVLDRDAVVICDGGDFVSYAGRYVDSFEPGCWLDPGPYGCLGTGLGYAAAARLAHPDRQVVLLLGDGAAGFSLMDVDTLVRHGLPVVMVVGNNGIWGLEKHPMKLLYGYDVAADLQPGCRYDEVVRALGGAGETVTDPSELGDALKRALAADAPYLVNVITDPADMYPRSSNLA
ncbi:acetolactate synthase [Rhabdothermincola sediminis]|uniref:acetolactate synthase n=1 Tax=Rhabdothermincola sediminis TaxID=2751370 RepID=UPI001AA03E48|nr:acetolactate synthase [Rhabdothermincola sediminis]